MYPEEKMARRVLARRNLLPPFDLDALATEYGELEYLNIPYDVDGITIGIGSTQKPRILVNESAPGTMAALRGDQYVKLPNPSNVLGMQRTEACQLVPQGQDRTIEYTSYSLHR
ncbi:hypothetical protein [Pseudomonas syringae]|uniref:hypothetical protein n=2 Tax=Pseudomonas syringae TaxID=317 RepID=UPI000357600E|nr:hypothetical protein IYO_001345 [Pseudomonas syringae pv. actinidiae ICMP 18884]AOE54733.1 hypothetical protein NZ708_01345 [Pseudomonas syringae pv. actinidiae ICMP 18708]APP95596.1 hypothetical protein PsaNZ45_01345 [Pseudomonas syringae pv. actinidiae]AYL78762.1 hypothetical protein CN228_01305 [Pseudomonas syringae pv. actinidiae str. Shaanxi_M228]EPN72232.1 hypothetical protein A233_24926 [Pseudomonas syringae pv. actinidiae ICMP 19097]MCQ4654343.1 hypothetical protein [Pseudomonas syr